MSARSRRAQYDLTIRLSLMAILTAACGCGGEKMPDLHPVSGTVTLDGKLLPDVTIVFTPMEGSPMAATGKTDASGKYTLTTRDKQGAPAGTYKVLVNMTRQEEATMTEEEAMAAFQKEQDGEGGGNDDEGGGGKEDEGKKPKKDPSNPVPSIYHSLGSTPFEKKVEAGEAGNTIDLKLESQ